MSNSKIKLSVDKKLDEALNELEIIPSKRRSNKSAHLNKFERQMQVVRSENKDMGDITMFKDNKNPVVSHLQLYLNGEKLSEKTNWRLKYPTREEIKPHINDYFIFCAESKIPISILGLALYLGVTTNTLARWASGETTTEYQEDIEKAIMLIHSFKEQLAETNQINSGVYIFSAKNWFGMKDVQEKRVVTEAKLSLKDMDRVIENIPNID